MSKPVKHAARDLGYSLLGPDYLPIGDAELEQRTADGGGTRRWRAIKSGEIEQLHDLGNWAADWGSVMVCDPFHPAAVQRCRFYGLVRIGTLENLVIEVDGRRAPVGLYDSTVISCDLGANVVIDRVGALAHAIVGDEAVLQGVGSLSTTRHAVFGNGWSSGAPDGAAGKGSAPDPDAGRCAIEVANEAGGRAILPFDGMIVADAWLWSRNRDDAELMKRLRGLTDAWASAWGENRPGRYSRIDAHAVVRDARTLIDVRIGSCARVIGVNRLENVTLLSDAEEPCHVAEGAVAVDGIVGYGCRLGHGIQARRFLLGARARLESGARLAHTVLGDNSTVAGCEVLNNLLFPFHEQHHNNSFLIAASVQGQSNVAAGATIGSNHNSRAPDGEILAARGFWPGLCVSLKHNCRFAAYTLLVKGDYPAELNIPLPFSLVSTDGEALQLIPAWWFLYNMYAVQRNEWKFHERDRRIHARQRIVTDALAPDTVEEILAALELIERWVGMALVGKQSIRGKDAAAEAVQARGRKALLESPAEVSAPALRADGIENGRRPVRILKVVEAYAAYRRMVHHYAVGALVDRMERDKLTDIRALASRLTLERERRWVNLGGQIVPGSKFERMRRAIGNGRIDTWHAVHAEYERLWGEYADDRAHHAGAALLALNGVAPGALDDATWREWVRRALETQETIAEGVRRSRGKDFDHPFRGHVYDSPAEMQAVLGKAEDDPFLAEVARKSEAFRRRLEPYLL